MGMTNQEIDTALILEGELKRRVGEVVGQILHREVTDIINNYIQKHKNDMMLEISMKVGQMLRGIAEEDRKPLWELGPVEMAGMKKYRGEEDDKE